MFWLLVGFPFFLRLHYICLSSPLGTDTCGASAFWLLGNMLLWAWGYNCLPETLLCAVETQKCACWVTWDFCI